MPYYRILEIGPKGRPRTLFHGVDRDRTLPIDTWIEAEVETVHDGSGGTEYQSGFHVLPERKQAVEYLRRFTKERPLVVAEVDAEDMWPKSHSRSEVQLARHMRIRPGQWYRAENPIGVPTDANDATVRVAEFLSREHVDLKTLN